MDIKVKVDGEALRKTCEDIARIYADCMVDEFTKWAMEDDAYLRGNNGFNDNTGNLRSSLGAAVYNDAKVVFTTSFKVVLSGSRGASEGMRAVERLADRTRGLIVKAMVAGMDYAQYVEDIDSKDVLESRRIQCERDARTVVERAAKRAERLIARL